MILTLAIYGLLFVGLLRGIPWVIRRWPKARNTAALVAETLAAWAAANALALVGAIGFPGPKADAPVLNGLVSGAFAVGAHYLGNLTASSPHPIYIPFVGLGLIMVLASGVVGVVIGLALMVIGASLGWAKYRSLRPQTAASL